MSNEFIFYGTGKIPDPRYIMAKHYVEEELNGKVLFCSDSKESLWDDKNIFPTEEIKKYPQATVVLFCGPLKTLKMKFENIGIHNELKIHPRFAFHFVCDTKENNIQKNISTWYKEHKELIENLFQTDDVTTKQMLKQIGYERTLSTYEFMDYANYVSYEYNLSHEGHYFWDKVLIKEKDFTFVDGGGYIGDTFITMINDHPMHLKKIYAFEPDISNVAKYSSEVKRLGKTNSVVLIQKGLWSKTTTLQFSANAEQGKICDEGEIKVDVTTIDETVKDVIGDLYIKMDVEGSEIEALKGAVKTIQKYKPYLQICLYHKMTDIYDIPKLIKSISPDYKLYLREGTHPEVLAVP